jgi:GH15 family glucan-1,4-alpha-glucosidase
VKRSSARQLYPPIGDYALIGDCHSAALIGKNGSIDWCCLPRFDSDSCFGRLLDWRQGGHFAVAPASGKWSASRAYVPDTLILVTTFKSARAEAKLYDFFAMRAGGRLYPRRQLLRILEGVRGKMEFAVEISPRLDYGDVKPWIYRVSDTACTAVGSNQGLLLFGDVELALVGEHDVRGKVVVRAGKRVHLSLQFLPPEELADVQAKACDCDELDRRFDETVKWWRQWSSKIDYPDEGGACVKRSAIVLKALEYALTGAIVAAPTTSLPERIGGERNWDYRYSWIRDSIFTVHALANLGCEAEADGFRRFIQRSAAGNADDLRVLYAVDGKRRLSEVTLDHLDGYRGSKPVRIGNAADRQFQSDLFGLILELSWRWRERGNSPDPQYWDFLVEIVEAAVARWHEPDRGIWEVRSRPRHFVHSKVMCWAAVNRGIDLAEACSLKAPLQRWTSAKHAIRAAIERRGYDARRGVFVQAFGSRELDAALLLLPQVGFVAYDDERMVRTVDAIRDQLDDGGLVLRYRTRRRVAERSADGLRGSEGVFLPCSFWLAECLARQGRGEEARELFDRVSACANELGLFSEELSPATHEMLGNFPQGLTHLAHVSAALALGEARAGG